MKILIADDHALFKNYISKYIHELNKESTIFEFSDFSQSLKFLQKEKMDIAIFDLNILEPNAEKNISEIQHNAPDSKIVIVSSSENVPQIKKIINTGISGYIPRSTDLNFLKEAFRQILEGNSYIPASLQEDEQPCKIDSKFLTNRQSQVLDLIAEGKSNKQIAYEMGVSEATVKLHINALLRSLKVSNRTEAVITAQKIGLI